MESREGPATEFTIEDSPVKIISVDYKKILHQHVEDEELLPSWSGRIDLVTANLPDCVLDVLLRKDEKCARSIKLSFCSFFLQNPHMDGQYIQYISIYF